MRVACICSPTGARYRIYRVSKDLETRLTQILPILLEPRFKTLIGGMDNEPDVVLTLGPLDATLDAEFREHLMKHLGIVPKCVN